MVLSNAQTDAMERACEDYCCTGAAPTRADAAALGVPFDSLSSLCRQMYVRHMKLTSKAQRQRVAEYRARFDAGEGVVAIARSAAFSPYCLMRWLLEDIHGGDRERVRRLVRAPRDELAASPRLLAELAAAEAADAHQGPRHDAARHAVSARAPRRARRARA